MGVIRFIPVTEINDPLTLSIGLSGGSGTGKTYTALLMARGIAEVVTGKPGAPIGYVDTENRRALHYKAAFPEMMHFDFAAVDHKGSVVGFGPERWIEVIDAAEEAGLPVLILDSFSHAWEGVGGVLDLHATTLDRLTRGDDSKKDQRSQLAWAEVKPRYRRLIDRIVRAKTNIIICTRAKPVMQDFKTKLNARTTKTRRKDVPWDPAADGDLMFEMTTMVILDPVAPGCPVHQIKVADQFKALLNPRQPMGAETGRRMAEWAKGQGSAQEQKAALDEARKHAPVAAFLAQHNGGPRMEAHPGHDARDPLSTVAASGSHQTPVAAFIARQFGASTGHAADTPLGTVTAGGQGKSQLVASWFAKYYGTGDGARADEPCHTVTVKDRMGHMQAELAAPPFAPEHHARARAVAEFLRTHDAWHGGEFVTLTIEGASYVVIDIGMRMLTPRELFRAQGFPADYVIEGVWEGLETPDPVWVPFAKDVQVSCCGNSVCPPLAEALVAANCGHLRVEQWGGAAAEAQEG